MERAGPDILADVLASLPAHTAVLGPDGRLLVVNDAWTRFCADNGGAEERCGPGSSYLEVCEATTGEMREESLEVAAGVRRVLSGEAAGFIMDYECSSPTQERWFQVSVVPLRGAPTPDGRPPGAVVVHSDITARKLDEAALLHEATHDPLIGLVDRALLVAELRRELQRASGDGSQVSVLFLDLDGFKAVNDSLGHRAGDELLRATAGRLRAVLRPGDHLARMGGDEFVAVLPRTGPATARRLARRLATAARAPVDLDGMPVTVSASIGIAATDAGTPAKAVAGAADPGTSQADDLLAAADQAMYRAKQRGRSRTEVFAGDLRARAEERTEVEGQLGAALQLDELQLFRQPVMSLDDGADGPSAPEGSSARDGSDRPDGAGGPGGRRPVEDGEALLRWFAPDGRLRSPDSFLDLTAHAPVARAVTRAVLLSAATAAAAAGCRVSVNIGLPDLRDPGLVDVVLAACAQAGLPPASLTVEVSEQAVMVEPDRAHRVLGALRGHGVRTALDDVGRGRLPLALLVSLPLDEVELDRSVTRSLHRQASRAVAHGLSVVAADLGLRFVACGVQTEADRGAVTDLGVRLGQGWALGPPEPWTVVRAAR
ncbi:putative bifunctional diguanylate cyclase/phosphodiesterase [Aquipuribacter hungaricus]|uniref:putative bifunctional diguanylate cyclase/phosphodiesterase n=1 Tax=Aquipuribacter hungaricus TaxID=545624 RepID=UPI003606D2CB